MFSKSKIFYPFGTHLLDDYLDAADHWLPLWGMLTYRVQSLDLPRAKAGKRP